MKKNWIFLSTIPILTAIITFCFCVSEIRKESSIGTSASITDYSNLSNKKICWGIKRADNHKQPDVGRENKSIMEKYNCLYLGNTDKKYVYLTFDAGYEAGYTEKILEVLKQNDVTATFFITGHYLNTQPDLVKKMIEGGNIVGNHAPNYLMSGVEKV